MPATPADSSQPISNYPSLFKVNVEHGQYSTATGGSRNYALYVPQASANLPKPPYPVAVLLHGFLMSGYQHSGNGQYLGQRGFIVLAPDLSKILLGDDTRMANVRDVLGEIDWLKKQSLDPQSNLFGLVDANRIAVAGNSAGGAVCLELILEAQKAKIPIRAFCALDGVPWDRTLDGMSKIEPLDILSLRAEPAVCNYHGRLLRYLAQLKFPFDDIKIKGAHHCDVENPSTFGCKCVCGASNERHRHLFQNLMYLYFRDKLNAPHFEGQKESFMSAVRDFQIDDRVVGQLNQSNESQIASQQPSPLR